MYQNAIYICISWDSKICWFPVKHGNVSRTREVWHVIVPVIVPIFARTILDNTFGLKLSPFHALYKVRLDRSNGLGYFFWHCHITYCHWSINYTCQKSNLLIMLHLNFVLNSCRLWWYSRPSRHLHVQS